MLSNLQLEILKTFSYPLPESQVLEIRALLSNYFLDKMDNEIDKLVQKNNWTPETFVEWSNEHNRTLYATNNGGGFAYNMPTQLIP